MTVPRFWRKIDNRYNLRGTRCGNCGTAFFPPRRICPGCRRDGSVETYDFEGRGEVITFTVIRAEPPSMDGQTPYVVAIIETPEGARFTSQLVDVEPDDVEIGMPVEATFRKIAEDGADGVIHYGVKFEPTARD
ncbi:MAG: hypothetical protein MAG715_00039 [Methanonatronarchaeales archaeon]|nr:hypothetical protein [Methanonatronarchaeales archaeon]